MYVGADLQNICNLASPIFSVLLCRLKIQKYVIAIRTPATELVNIYSSMYVD